uniref:Uncharacterized protein n=1 Tax=Oryza glumipatula TaxID=40148 RepID=A0A0D9Z0X9_9ORYZ
MKKKQKKRKERRVVNLAEGTVEDEGFLALGGLGQLRQPLPEAVAGVMMRAGDTCDPTYKTYVDTFGGTHSSSSATKKNWRHPQSVTTHPPPPTPPSSLVPHRAFPSTRAAHDRRPAVVASRLLHTIADAPRRLRRIPDLGRSGRAPPPRIAFLPAGRSRSRSNRRRRSPHPSPRPYHASTAGAPIAAPPPRLRRRAPVIHSASTAGAPTTPSPTAAPARPNPHRRRRGSTSPLLPRHPHRRIGGTPPAPPAPTAPHPPPPADGCGAATGRAAADHPAAAEGCQDGGRRGFPLLLLRRREWGVATTHGGRGGFQFQRSSRERWQRRRLAGRELRKLLSSTPSPYAPSPIHPPFTGGQSMAKSYAIPNPISGY